MYETNEDLKNKAANLADSVKNNVSDMAHDVQDSVDQIAQSAQYKASQTKQEAMNVIESLKSLINQYASSTNVDNIKNQILDKAYELKGTVSDEVANAYTAGKDRTAQAIQEKPLLSLGLAIGAGVLLGYILGSKQSSR